MRFSYCFHFKIVKQLTCIAGTGIKVTSWKINSALRVVKRQSVVKESDSGFLERNYTDPHSTVMSANISISAAFLDNAKLLRQMYL